MTETTLNGASAREYVALVHVYASILAWQRHASAMASSMRHAATMLGEIDEPGEPETYDPLGEAAFFGITSAMQILVEASDGRKTDPQIIEGAIPVAVQLIFALLRDDQALAGVPRYLRTGFIGDPEERDRHPIPELKKLLRKMAQFADEFSTRAVAGDWDSVLSRRVTPYKAPAYTETLPHYRDLWRIEEES